MSTQVRNALLIMTLSSSDASNSSSIPCDKAHSEDRERQYFPGTLPNTCQGSRGGSLLLFIGWCPHPLRDIRGLIQRKLSFRNTMPLCLCFPSLRPSGLLFRSL